MLNCWKYWNIENDKPHALGSWAGPRPRGGGPGTQMAQGPGTQGHTKPLTLTLTLKLMLGTINLTTFQHFNTETLQHFNIDTTLTTFTCCEHSTIGFGICLNISTLKLSTYWLIYPRNVEMLKCCVVHSNWNVEMLICWNVEPVEMLKCWFVDPRDTWVC